MSKCSECWNWVVVDQKKHNNTFRECSKTGSETLYYHCCNDFTPLEIERSRSGWPIGAPAGTNKTGSGYNKGINTFIAGSRVFR